MRDKFKSKYVDGLVSVVIPVYNAEKYISQTLQSVISQNYKSIEIIVVDDCSTDSSRDIIIKIDSPFPIRYHKLLINSGAAIARNEALKIAKGRYVAFLDSDDLWTPSKIKSQLDFMNEKKCMMVYTAIDMLNENGEVIKQKCSVPLEVSYKTLLKNTVVATSTVLIDRWMLGDFSMPNRRSGQDYATWLSILRDGKIAYGINEALVHYRKTSNSLSSNKFKSIKQVFEIQKNDEKINVLIVCLNVLHFCYNAINKHYL